MQILLLKSIGALGNPGQLVEVKPGYARNYLIPKGFAIFATPKNVKAFSHQKKIAETQRSRFLDDLKVLVEEIKKVELLFSEKVGPHGKLYGSVTNRAIAEALSQALGADIDRRKVILDEPIRTPGEFEVDIHLDHEVHVKVSVRVEGELVEEPAPAKESGDEKAAEESSEESDDDGEADE